MNFKDSNEETSDESRIDEVDIGAVSSRDCPIEVLPDIINKSNSDLRVTRCQMEQTPERQPVRANTRANPYFESDDKYFSDSDDHTSNISESESTYEINSDEEILDEEISNEKLIFENMLIMTTPEYLNKIIKTFGALCSICGSSELSCKPTVIYGLNYFLNIDCQDCKNLMEIGLSPRIQIMLL